METHNHPIFIQGRQRLAVLVELLLRENSLSHADLQALYRWSCPETASWFASSQVSSLRNAKLPKPGAQVFMAIAEINLRLAQLAGDDSPAVKELSSCGPLPPKLKRLKDIKPFFVVNPKTGFPMDVGDIFKVYCGKIDIDGEEFTRMGNSYTKLEAKELSGQLAVWAQRWMVKQGLIPLLARTQVMDHYPIKNKERQDRLWDVILGQQEFTAKELVEEVDALRFLIGGIERESAFNIREFERWRQGLPV